MGIFLRGHHSIHHTHTHTLPNSHPEPTAHKLGGHIGVIKHTVALHKAHFTNIVSFNSQRELGGKYYYPILNVRRLRPREFE